MRCAICPNLDVCLRCFNCGSVSTSHDKSHPWFKAKATKYPVEWSVIFPAVPNNAKRNSIVDDFSFLQYRDISPADYGRLLLLDQSAKTVPLHEHLCKALPAVNSSHEKKCDFCTIPLSVDITARVFPCGHTVHHSCAASIILSALSESECEGIAVNQVTCPFCLVDNESGAKSTLLFPLLQREPKTRSTARKKINPPKEKPCDVTNVISAIDNCNLANVFSVRSCRGNYNIISSSTKRAKENRRALPTRDKHTKQPNSAHVPTLSVGSANPPNNVPDNSQRTIKSFHERKVTSISKAKCNAHTRQSSDSMKLDVVGVSKS